MQYEALRRIPVFSELSEAELETVGCLAVTRQYRKGMILFMEGEPGEGLFFLRQGKVKLSKLLEDGREKILHFVQEGDIFAEVLLFDGGPYPATAEVMEDCQAGLIRNQDIEGMLKQNPDLCFKILRVMSRRLRQAQMQNRDLAFQDAYGRLGQALLNLGQEYGRETAGGVVLELGISQQELGNLIGASRETVARILSDFKKSGAIVLDKRRLVIKDKETLAEWSR